MSQSRIEILKASLQDAPDDTFTIYLLAMEYRAQGELATAIRMFREITSKAPDYVPAHFMLAQCLEQEDELDEAREAYATGIETARKAGDAKAAAEMQEALDLLDDS